MRSVNAQPIRPEIQEMVSRIVAQNVARAAELEGQLQKAGVSYTKFIPVSGKPMVSQLCAHIADLVSQRGKAVAQAVKQDAQFISQQMPKTDLAERLLETIANHMSHKPAVGTSASLTEPPKTLNPDHPAIGSNELTKLRKELSDTQKKLSNSEEQRAEENKNRAAIIDTLTREQSARAGLVAPPTDAVKREGEKHGGTTSQTPTQRLASVTKIQTA